MHAEQLIEMRCAELAIPASATEKERWASRYAGVRASVDALYQLDDVKYEDLGVVFAPQA